MSTQKFSLYAPFILRIGISVVYLWFGFQQFIDVKQWIGFVPPGVLALSPVDASTLVYINGAIEIIFGTALLFGLFVRTSAIILALHMVNITLMVGYNAIGVRDFGILMATFAIVLFGPDIFSIDFHRRPNVEKNIEDRDPPLKPNTPVQFSTSMINNHEINMVVDYIKREQKRGTPINNIRDSLFIKGWSAADIDKAYKILGQNPTDSFQPLA